MSPTRLCECGHVFRHHGNPFTRQHTGDGGACFDERCNCVEFKPKKSDIVSFETKEEQMDRETAQLPITAFNAVTEECFYGYAMRMALKEDPEACKAFIRIAERTKQLRNAAEAFLSREALPRGT